MIPKLPKLKSIIHMIAKGEYLPVQIEIGSCLGLIEEWNMVLNFMSIKVVTQFSLTPLSKP